MKKIALLFSLLVLAYSANASERLTVKLKGAEDILVCTSPLAKFGFNAEEPAFPKGRELSDGSLTFDIPDDGQTYVVLVGANYKGCDELQTNISLVFLPGEAMTINGKAHEGYADFKIKGSKVFADYAKRYPKMYAKYVKMTIDEELVASGPEGVNPEKEKRLMEVLEDFRTEQINFIKANPDKQLSAIYFAEAVMGYDKIDELYNMLGERVKSGPYKEYIDFYRQLAATMPAYCPAE